MLHKTCSKCGNTKPIDDFCKDNRRIDGYSSHCKSCRRSYYSPRPWKSKPLSPNDQKVCTKCHETKLVSEFDKRAEGRTGYHSHCKSCRRKISQSWKKTNKKNVKEYNENYRKNCASYYQKWWREHKDKARQYTKRFYGSERGRLYNRNSQSQRRVLERAGDIALDYLQDLFEKQTNCAYCHSPFSQSIPPTIDHIIPIAKGGTHTRDNIVLACNSCNSRKRDNLLAFVSDSYLK